MRDGRVIWCAGQPPKITLLDVNFPSDPGKERTLNWIVSYCQRTDISGIMKHLSIPRKVSSGELKPLESSGQEQLCCLNNRLKRVSQIPFLNGCVLCYDDESSVLALESVFHTLLIGKNSPFSCS